MTDPGESVGGDDDESDDPPADGAESERATGEDVTPPPTEEDLPEDAFREMDVGEIDDDAVVAALAQDGEPDPEAAPDEVVVPKRKYCERCEHFAGPPDATCTNEGTEILALVDMEHFKVANCPVVAEQRRIGATDIREPEG